jgi:phage antirepressor YoqD-like protein
MWYTGTALNFQSEGTTYDLLTSGGGGAGPAGISGLRVFDFTTPTTLLTITHSLGQYPMVQVLDDQERVIIPISISHSNVNEFKVEFAEKIVNTGNGVSIGDFAKTIGLGQNKLFDWLRKNKYLMSNNIPYQQYIDNGYFKVIEWVLEKKNEAKFKTLITGKGQEYISSKIS